MQSRSNIFRIFLDVFYHVCCLFYPQVDTHSESEEEQGGTEGQKKRKKAKKKKKKSGPEVSNK